MPRRKALTTIAGIDVGSNSIAMTIGTQMKGKRVKKMERLSRPTMLGRDSFNIGKIQYETVDKACETLRGFKQLLLDYDITDFRAVATSALREAENGSYVIDQINLRTGLKIDVISNAEERLLIYKCLDEELRRYTEIKKEGVLILYIGSGNIQVSVYEKGRLAVSRNIKLGTLRVMEMLSAFKTRRANFAQILEEYIDVNIDMSLMESCKISNFIAIFPEGGLLKRFDDKSIITRARFLKDYTSVIKEAARGNVDPYLPAMLMIKKFSRFIDGNSIYIPNVRLCDGVMYDKIDNVVKSDKSERYTADTIWSARYIARRYRYDQKHADNVERFALKLFDSLGELHGLGNRERLLLQLAAILHDTGRFVNVDNHYHHSYSIVMESSLIGISDDETQIIANVTLAHSADSEDKPRQLFILTLKSQVIMAKLTAIIRLADALDASQLGKISDIDVSCGNDAVKVAAYHAADISLEEFTFELKREYFSEVFGVTPILISHTT